MATVGRVSGETAAEVPDHALRSALEFAVGIAAAGVKLRPPLAFPVELKRFLRSWNGTEHRSAGSGQPLG